MFRKTGILQSVSLRTQALEGLRARRAKGIFWRKEHVAASLPGLLEEQNLYRDNRDMWPK